MRQQGHHKHTPDLGGVGCSPLDPHPPSRAEIPGTSDTSPAPDPEFSRLRRAPRGRRAHTPTENSHGLRTTTDPPAARAGRACRACVSRGLWGFRALRRYAHCGRARTWAALRRCANCGNARSAAGRALWRARGMEPWFCKVQRNVKIPPRVCTLAEHFSLRSRRGQNQGCVLCTVEK